MKKIFVDMDGVLTDFNRRYTELFGQSPKEVIKNGERGTYSKNWHAFVDDGHFATLDNHEGAVELIEFLRSLNGVQLCILTSAGGFDRHIHVQIQKLKWLVNNNIAWPAVVVPGRRYKSGFASGDAFMIDDTPDVIKGFCESGGHGIVHTDAQTTIEVITKWLK